MESSFCTARRKQEPCFPLLALANGPSLAPWVSAHRITESFGLQGTFRDSLVQPRAKSHHYALTSCIMMCKHHRSQRARTARGSLACLQKGTPCCMDGETEAGWLVLARFLLSFGHCALFPAQLSRSDCVRQQHSHILQGWSQSPTPPPSAAPPLQSHAVCEPMDLDSSRSSSPKLAQLCPNAMSPALCQLTRTGYPICPSLLLP